MYDPIYSQNIGLCGFRCRVGSCTKVVRSYRGIVMHCKRVHGLKAQTVLPFPVKEKEDGQEASAVHAEPIRADAAGRDTMLANVFERSTEDS
jgi:hypothetical protein